MLFLFLLSPGAESAAGAAAPDDRCRGGDNSSAWPSVDSGSCKYAPEAAARRARTWDMPMAKRLRNAQLSHGSKRGTTGGISWKSTQPSGPGSTLQATTEHRAFLARVLAKYNIRNMVDVPCGDMTWMPAVSMPPSTSYFGGDISRSIVSFNQQRFAEDERFCNRFRAFDITCEVVRLGAEDLLHTKDVLFHMPTELAVAAVINFERSGAGFFVSTSFGKAPSKANRYSPSKHGDNGAYADASYGKDDEVIGFTPINLEAPPFCFPPPLALSLNKHTHVDLQRYTGLWSLPALNRSTRAECVHDHVA